MERTNYNGELRLQDVGKKVKLVGWVSTRRNLGAIEFIDLRDNTGLVQLTIQDSSKVPDVRNEYVIAVEGVVAKKEQPNPKLDSGEVEVLVSSLTIVNKAENPPFIIADKTDALEDTRLQYRYLDLRRPVMLNNLRTRAKIVKLTHEYLDANRFLEVETPILNIATPEGARDYLVPSRLHHAQGVEAEVVSMPCLEVFDEQDESYQKSVLSLPKAQRYSFEMGSGLGWYKYADHVFSVEEFGRSAPGADVLKAMGWTAEDMAKKVLETLH